MLNAVPAADANMHDGD